MEVTKDIKSEKHVKKKKGKRKKRKRKRKPN
jgi:hypothetical protein